jgi:hypothetical protein
MPTTTTIVRALLGSLFDYAGLFPPAALDLDATVEQYRGARRGPYQALLGSLVVPAARLDTLVEVLARQRSRLLGERSWPVSVLLGNEPEVALAQIERIRALDGHPIRVGSVEIAPAEPAQVRELAKRIPPDLQVFFETPADARLQERLAAVGSAGACAKIRTGGGTAASFPSAAALARFLVACRQAGVPFKATAGLHHAVRGEYPLSYEPASQRATMHGFLNLAVAAALCHAQGTEEAVLVRVLAERDATAFRFSESELGWHDDLVDCDAVERTRRGFLCAIGSCSFHEPIDELVQLGLAKPRKAASAAVLATAISGLAS